MSQQNHSHSDSGQFSKILSLKFILGSWPLGYKLILEGNAVNVTPDPCSFNNEPMTCIPSIEEWNKFLESIERLDVLNWKESYIDPSILDGTQWLFQIRTESFEIETGGSNAYPENFNGLIMSINKLIPLPCFTLGSPICVDIN